MRVLIFNIIDQYGSTGKIAQILKKGYEDAGHEVTVCYGRIKKGRQPSDSFKFTYDIESYFTYFLMRLFGVPGMGLHFSMKRLFRYLNNEKPDYVHLLNIHGYYVDEYALLEYLKKKSIPTIFTMCDEYAYTAKCCFTGTCDKFKKECCHCELKRSYPPSWIFDTSKKLFNKKSRIYNGFDKLVFAGCGYVYDRAKESKLLRDKRLVCVGEPIDLDSIFYPRKNTNIRQKLGIPDGNIVVMTAAVLSNPRKGGQYFLELYQEMKGKEGYSFVFVGYDTTVYDELTDETMIKIPYVESLDSFAELMSLADVFVSTTLADTVPNAVINALGCGTPVCAFEIGGMSSIRKKDEDVLKLVPLYNIPALKQAIQSFGIKSDSLVEKCRNLVYQDFSSQNVITNYINVMKKLTCADYINRE